jgi:hypothetical protein
MCREKSNGRLQEERRRNAEDATPHWEEVSEGLLSKRSRGCVDFST